MFKGIKKIGSVVLGLSVIGIVSVGFHSSFTQQASHADLPAPQNPNLAYNKGDTWSPQRFDLTYSHGNTGGSPAYGHADFPVSADGDTGVSVGDGGGIGAQATHGEGWSPQRPNLAYNIGDTWSPSYAHGDTGIVSNEAEGNTPAPAYNIGDTPVQQA